MPAPSTQPARPSRPLAAVAAAALLLPLVAAMAAVPTLGSAAAAEATEFRTSFEASDPEVDWVNEPEIGPDGEPWTRGVDGSSGGLITGDVTDRVTDVTASGENPPGEGAANLADGETGTKWLAFQRTPWVRYELEEPVAVRRYSLTAANDAPDRDPVDWRLRGSQDGTTWTEVDTRTGQDLGDRFETTVFQADNSTAYRYYRLDIDANGGADATQLAELRISDGSTTQPPPSPMQVEPGDGPARTYTARSRVGFTGVSSLRYAGRTTRAAGGHAWAKVYDVDVPVTPTTELSYRILPELTKDDLRYPSTYAAVDLAFTDGTYLSQLDAVDQNGFGASPRAQGESKSLYAYQWNHRAVALGQVAAGKTVDRVLVGYDSPHGNAAFGGWIDDIAIEPVETVDTGRPSDHVVTTRGTNSNGTFSRGNNIPAAAVPHGFNFWSPVTNAGSLSWIYDYAAGNDEQNRTRLQALSLSHETSPWMGDRQTWQVMPQVGAGPPTADREDRSVPFSHDDETASPHHYRVELANGLVAEVTPTDHAAIMRFTFPADTPAEGAHLVFDNVNDDGGLSIDPSTGTVTGYTDTRSGLSVGATRMFVHGRLDAPVTDSGAPPGTPRPDVSGYVTVDPGADRTVELRVATSLISQSQARRNLAMEIAAGDTFEDVVERAQDAWDEVLGVIEVEGATPTQLTTLYSNLYRLSLYPNSGHENTGAPTAPLWRHASPVAPQVRESTPTQTGAKIVNGKIYVNNGFWDTYRTTWPAYSLLYPEMAGEMVDGFVQQYREGGWVSRWSSPGYANLMTGTSSDVSFADAYTKGVDGFNAVDAYDAAVRNATVAPPGGDPDNTDVGRKGLQQSIFLGYTPDQVSEGVSWALEGYVNDYGIAQMAAGLAADRSLPRADRRRYREEHAYFLDRSRRYDEMFDPAVGFFQGRDAAGEWKSGPAEYDPEEWGHDHDYTETNGWNFAFHAAHDPAGLAALYGGRTGLARKLDRFFATPERADKPGSYGGIIHEITEARDVRLGMWGFSNQVSHHIPWMYVHARQPWKTQALVREVLSRHYTGSEIGQGYAGDEDNGETSAWWLFASLGLYPLQLGSGTYVAGSPLFTKATVHLEGGEDLVIEAPRNSAENVYVQGVTVDGVRHDEAWFAHDELADGATVRFRMGPEPSTWGSASGALPPSPSDDPDIEAPLADRTGTDGGTASGVEGAARLFDDTSGTETVVRRGDAVQYRFFATRQQVSRYTLTSGAGAGDPTGWRLQGSRDGRSWTTVDERSGQSFRWRRQTRPFEVAQPAAYRYWRVRVTGTTQPASALSEIELFGVPAGQVSDEDWVEQTLASIDLGDTSDVTADLELPQGDAYAWETSDPDLVRTDGRLVRRPEVGAESAAATLTVTVTRNEASGTREFPVTVAPWTQAEWEATGVDLQTSFEAGDPATPRNAWLRNEDVGEFCCGIGGMETANGTGSDESGEHTGERILLYSGAAIGEGPSSASNAVLVAPGGTWVRPGTTYSWWVHPQGGSNTTSPYVAMDLTFTDGTQLTERAPLTTGGDSALPEDLGPTQTVGEWQQVVVDVGAVAAGRQVETVDLSFGSGALNGTFRGFVDDIVMETGGTTR